MVLRILTNKKIQKLNLPYFKNRDFLNLFATKNLAKYGKKDILFLCLLCIPPHNFTSKSYHIFLNFQNCSSQFCNTSIFIKFKIIIYKINRIAKAKIMQVYKTFFLR